MKFVENAQIPRPKELQDVSQKKNSEFALSMLNLSMRSMEHKDTLLGMAWALKNLHEALATSTSFEDFSLETKAVLTIIAHRERLDLQICLNDIQSDQTRYAQFYKKYQMIKSEIETIFFWLHIHL